MKRTLLLIFVSLVAIGLVAGLVHVVLVAAHVSDSAATTVYGPTSRRLWATMAALLSLVGVVIGGLALRRSARRCAGNVSVGAIGALVAGTIAVVNGALNLAVATGGPGSGNGVVGAAGALVLGVIAMALGGLALARSRRAAGNVVN